MRRREEIQVVVRAVMEQRKNRRRIERNAQDLKKRNIRLITEIKIPIILSNKEGFFWVIHEFHRGKHHHKDRHDREDKSSRRRNSKDREREEVKYEGSYPQGLGKDDGQGKGPDGRSRGAWQKGYINNLIGGQGGKDGRDRKDKRSK